MTHATIRAAIALGSNAPERLSLLQSGNTAVAAIAGVQLLAASRIEDTEPFGPPQPRFLNQMVLVETTLGLEALLAALQDVERQHGRVRTIQKGPRTLDLDIVWADGITITAPDLLVPHPGLCDREFWQRELAELLGDAAAATAVTEAQVHAGLDTSRLPA